ncbi:MAG: hypothetical protein LBI42_09680 [Chitinispirillales bacterium]|jgi:hypothetical protein|nr:hypothetical protein [Chitinispirillales bacterium]
MYTGVTKVFHNPETDLYILVYNKIKTYLKQQNKYPQNTCEILAAMATNSMMRRTQMIKKEKKLLKLVDSSEVRKMIDNAIKTIPGLSDPVIKIFLNVKLYLKQQTSYSLNKCEYMAADALGSIVKAAADESAVTEYLADKDPSEYLDISELTNNTNDK